MGLLDVLDIIKKEGSKYLKDAMPGGLLNPEIEQHANETAQNIRNKGKAFERAIADPNQAGEAYKIAMDMVGMAPLGLTVWHGSPHKFSKFDMSKIGTGEGAQAYGHGLYMAESPEVAKSYAEVLPKNAAFNGMPIYEIDTSSLGRRSTMVTGYTHQGNSGGVGGRASYTPKGLEDEYDGPIAAYKDLVKKGLVPRNAPKWIDPVSGNIEVSSQGANMYKVDIPDEAVARFLDWDKPLSQQAPEVQKQLKRLYWENWDEIVSKNPTGEALYTSYGPGVAARSGWMDDAKVGADGTARMLDGNGIHGIRYLDGGSRANGAGSSNFVLFNDKLPRILEVNGSPTGLMPWGANEFNGLLK